MSKARSRARRLAMQGLYEWQVAANSPEQILATSLQDHDLSKLDEEYFKTLLLGVPAKAGDIDAAIKPFLSRPLNEVDPIELAILRLAAYELMYRTDIPYRVVINEAVELAKTFGAEAGHKFVNGILDKVAAQVREVEVIHKRKE